jgi:predicted dehydrogenase
MLRLGIVDCDTSHVVAFSRQINHVGVSEDHRVDGARVVAAYRGTSEISSDAEIDAHVRTIRDECGVEIVDSVEDLFPRIDAVLITSQGGRVHAGHALPFLQRGVPTYVDKPFTCSAADARRMVEAAQAAGTVLFSASSLRYALEVQDLAQRRAEVGAVLGCDAYSPAALHPSNPGLFHYGIHAVETLYQIMGPGCTSVTCVSEEGAEVVVGRWADGRLGTVRGTRQGPHDYGFTAFCERAIVPAHIDATYIYRELLKVMIAALRDRTWPVSAAELVEVPAFVEAALASQQAGGRQVALA